MAVNGSQSSDEEECLLPDEEGGITIDGIYIPPPTKPYCQMEEKGPRLIITNIVNNFFKSYAANVELGPFHHSFNSIVGPNGSGKSNVIDSMLFVFGYKASRLRSKKLSVLIHNSSSYQNVRSCSVAVHFALIEDKEDGNGDLLSDSQFVISRTAFKDNSSYYEVNGNKAQFRDIAALLKKYGIDLIYNRFLILQGEVEDIAMMKPKGTSEHDTGMLEYLEDIIGTTRFKKPLKQLEDRVELLSEQLGAKLNRLQAVETQIEDMRPSLEEAIQYLTLENSINKCHHVICQKKIQDLKESTDELESELLECNEHKIKMDDHLKSISNELAKKQDECNNLAKTYNDLLTKMEKVKTAKEEACKTDTKLQDEMIEINKARKKNKSLLEAEEKTLEKLQRLPEQNKELLVKCRSKLETFMKEKVVLDEQKRKIQESLKGLTTDLQNERDSVQADLNKLMKNVHETEGAYKLADSELKLHTESEDKSNEMLKNLERNINETTQTIKHNEVELQTLKKKIPLTEQSLQEATNDMRNVKKKQSQLHESIYKEKRQLEEIRSSMVASKSNSRVLDALMQQKREGKCPGLFGRLGDLGAIDLNYDVAVSTACGPLDHLVVDTIDTAVWCIEFLKRHDIGRADIIALEKQQNLWKYINQPIKTPEELPRLFDLIRVENEELKPAFYYGLRDTLVANNLDQATRVAYGRERYRVVTLKGELIELTGTMTGGGNRVSRGRMGQSILKTQVNPQEIERIEAEVANIEQELRNYNAKQNSLENQIGTLETELNRMKYNNDKLTTEDKALKKQLALMQEKFTKQRTSMQNTKRNSKLFANLTNDVKKKKRAYDEAVESTVELQQKVEAISNEIHEKTNSKLHHVNGKIKEVESSIQKFQKEITKLEVEIRTAERNTTKSMQTIERLKNDITAAEEDLQSKRQIRTEIESDALKLEGCYTDLDEDIEEKDKYFNKAKEIVKKFKSQQQKTKSDMIEIEQKFSGIEEKLKEVKHVYKQWKTKMDSLQLHEIPDKESETFKILNDDELISIDVRNIEKDRYAHEVELKKLKPDIRILDEYKTKIQFYNERSEEVNQVTNHRAKIKDHYKTLRTRRKDEFLNAYNIIKLKFQEMYRMITLGEGDADFELVDTFDPFSEGVVLNVRPPRKTWKIITNLSGGEKTLTSLALVFGLHYYKPSPLYVMDEIDAALDFKNVSIVANYIKERTKNAQFIIISLRSYTFELSNHLIGIYKTFDKTNSVTIEPIVIAEEKNEEDNREM